MMKHYFATISLLIIFISAFSQPNNSELSIPQIMKGQEFIGQWPENPYWHPNGEIVYFKWNKNPKDQKVWYSYNLNTKKMAKVEDNAVSFRIPQDYVWNKAKTIACFEQQGDIFLYDLQKNKITQITNSTKYEGNPHFTNAEKVIAYTSNDNLYGWNILEGTTTQLTNIKSGTKPDNSLEPKEEQAQWLYQDQMQLFKVVRDEKQKEQERLNEQHKRNLRYPEENYIGKKSVFSFQASPDGTLISYLTYKSNKSESTTISNFVTSTGYTKNIKTRPKVGEEPSEYEMYIYNTQTRKHIRLNTEKLEGMQDKPHYFAEYPNKNFPEIKNRTGYISGPYWNNAGTKAVIHIRANDSKDRWIALLDSETGDLDLIERQHNDAWIDGPGIGYFSDYSMVIGWMPDDETIWYQSEESGYSHIYTTNTRTKKKKQITSGNYEIFNPSISKDQKHWYFSSNKVHPGEVHFYRSDIKGKNEEQLTQKTGSSEITLSPDETKCIVRYSNANTPWELFLSNLPTEKETTKLNPEQITTSTTANFNHYKWQTPENITFLAQDGAKVHARLYKPTEKEANKAAIIFVHGAGYLQNAHKYWSGYYREYMFHNFLTDNGYTVLDIDYRGSAGYGSKWRTGIYRHMGGKDLSDQVDGAKYLVSNHGIDAAKIGIYGGSYGGFITIMAMFKAPETFKAGAAIRSVTDWAHYNHGYTANILNTPVLDSIAYRNSSPIYYAEGLKGHLLMLHGMIDDNVHFQDVVRLSQKLIELGKENWDVAIYPVEKHGFKRADSWTDEYKRIYKLFEEQLNGK